MYKKDKFELEINKDKYITTDIINIEPFRTILSLKQEDNKYSTLICKLYKKNNLKLIDKKIYNKIYKKNISSKFLETIKTKKQININQFINIDKSSYDNNIDIFEINGFTNLLHFLMLSFNFNLENYKDIINIIDITLNKIDILNKDLNILNRDINLNNIMIKNNYTIYLFNLFIMLKNEKDEQKQKNLNDNLQKILLHKENDDLKKYQDKELKKKGYKNINLINNDLNIDININDFDFIMNYKDIIKYTNKYDLKDKKTKDIIEFIMKIFYYYDKLFFICCLFDELNYNKSIIKNEKGEKNFKLIIEHLIKKYNEIINIISNLNFSKNKNEFLIKYLLDLFLDILHHYDIYDDNILVDLNQHIFDNIFEFLYNEDYLKDEYKILSHSLTLNIFFYFFIFLFFILIFKK